ncbi:cation:proton antiporter [Paucilactobacillus kaifaensis]|uniref:cation:proton antiporter n=1 Tax=Paucilactobacillus kaifaensis TaxID=2559921 RepID=UPI0010F49576|nr:sodium:proton antiporter [Paucilactobacillus kaifaensis]
MHTIFFILSMLVAVVIANVVYRHYSKIPLPIYFIIFGVALAIFPLFRNFTLDPSLFILAVIAPLLYNEAQSASRYWIGRGAINIFSLSIVLVIFTVIVVGVLLHSIFSFIPLVLAFTLCAIVTPTDAAAVSTLTPKTEEYKIPQIIMQNESLFNDASGIVIFDLALTVFITDTFSVNHALSVFFIQFVGGLILGAVIGLIVRSILRLLIGLNDDTSFIMVSVELIVPFIVYFIGEELHISGILAVVAAGLVQGSERDNLGLVSSRMQLVRANVWEIVEEALSGGVFVLLGVSLPMVIKQITDQHAVLIWLLILAGFVLYIAKFTLRLLWTRYLVWMHKESPHRWTDSWIMAFSGVSGTISLSLAFLLPETINGHPFTYRPMLIFIATVVILASIVFAAVLLPRLTREEPVTNEQNPDAWLRKMIIAGIREISDDKEYPAEASIVVDTISQQLSQRRFRDSRLQRKIFLEADEAERKAVKELADQQKIGTTELHNYIKFLDLSLFTVSGNIWHNLFLRVKFGIHISRRRELSVGQNMLLTSPLISEQLYWQRVFELDKKDIHPIESVGFDAAMKAIEPFRHHKTSRELHVVQRYYRERHRRMNLPTPSNSVIYQLFLRAFHAEYEFFQQAMLSGDLPAEIAEQLQQHIVYDEMAYLQKRASFMD